MTEPSTSPPATPTADGAPVRTGLVIGLLVVSAFVMILNETIMSLAIPHLIGDLAISASTAQWLTSGFLLTMAVVIPTTGFVLERFTVRQVYLAAMSLFSAGTVICALAPGFAVLLVGRVVQACGTAVMLPLLITTVMTLIPPHRRGATMGTISIVIAVAPAIGPTIAGAVLSALSWRFLFWVVLPLAVIALIVGIVTMRLRTATRPVPLDVLSVVLSAVGFAGIVYGFSAIGASAEGDSGVPPWIPLVVGAVALVLFVVRQRRLEHEDRALLNLQPFGVRAFVVEVVLAGLVFMALLGAGAVLLPFYLQNLLGTSAFTAGLAVLPGGLVLGLLGRPVGRLYDRFGARPLVIPGSIAMAVALWLFALLGAGAALGLVIAVHILLMASLGFMMTPLLTDALAVLPDRLYPHGSAIMTTIQQIAGAAGTAAFVAVAALGAANPLGAPDAPGLRLAFAAAGCVGVLGVVAALFVRPKRDQVSMDPEGPAKDDRERAASQS